MKYFSVAILLVVGLCACERKMTVAARDQKIKDTVVAYIMSLDSSISEVDTANALLEVDTLTAFSYGELLQGYWEFSLQLAKHIVSSDAEDMKSLDARNPHNSQEAADIQLQKEEIRKRIQEVNKASAIFAHVRDSISRKMLDCSNDKSVHYAVRFHGQVLHLNGRKNERDKLYVLDPSFRLVDDYDIISHKLVKHRGKWLFGIEREYN